MDAKTFDKYFDEIFNKSEEIFLQARKEYAENEDVFKNFEALESILNISREEVLFVYFYKHVLGISNYLKGVKKQRDSIEGRILDAINYLIMLYAMIKERKEKEKEQCDTGEK